LVVLFKEFYNSNLKFRNVCKSVILMEIISKK
jgi:hypothetical protein